jgi:PTH1 family peptidyl-tRNA hydrolase
MKIIVGLGNPGQKYEKTRHNAGFLAINRLVERWKPVGPVSKYKGQLYSLTHLGSDLEEPIYLVKPTTYMNLSGECVGPLFGFYRCLPQDLVVIHDDLALPSMALRIKTGGGTGGHNGLKSIDECIGKSNNQYHRIRIGIGHPSEPKNLETNPDSQISPADYVLQSFREEELKALDSLLEDVVDAVQMILQGNIQTAMNHYHRSKPEKLAK